VLDRPDFTYLAPAAAGRTWYPFGFMSPTEQNEPGISSGITAIDSLVRDVIAHGIQREHIMLLGFSQGGCLVGTFAIRHPARYGGVILYSGGLIGPPGTVWDENGAFEETPVFLGCSDIDSHIPLSRVEESAAVFERMGAEVTKRIYPGMGHLVNADEIRFTQRIMDGVLAVRP
jgi:predicted esterase